MNLFGILSAKIWEIFSYFLTDESNSHDDYSLETVWTFEYVSRTIDTRNSVYKITYTVILNKYQHEHLQNYKLHWLCMHIHTSGNSVVSPVCLVSLPLTTLVSEYLLNSYLLNVSNVLARTSSDLEDWMSTRESSQYLELYSIVKGYSCIRCRSYPEINPFWYSSDRTIRNEVMGCFNDTIYQSSHLPDKTGRLTNLSAVLLPPPVQAHLALQLWCSLLLTVSCTEHWPISATILLSLYGPCPKAASWTASLTVL